MLVVVEVAAELVLGVVADERAEVAERTRRRNDGDHDQHAEHERGTHGPAHALRTENIGLHEMSLGTRRPRPVVTTGGYDARLTPLEVPSDAARNCRTRPARRAPTAHARGSRRRCRGTARRPARARGARPPGSPGVHG